MAIPSSRADDHGRPTSLQVLAKFQMFCALIGCVIGLRSPAAAQSNQESSRQAIAHYADAAQFQNQGAFELAIEEWESLLSKFPDDPLAPKAQHYLGVCYSELKPPKFEEAIQAYEQSLKAKLDLRDETLIRVAESIYLSAQGDESSASRRQLKRAKDYLVEYLKDYSDRATADQALFYLGEIEYSLGEVRRSLSYHNKLLTNARFKKSKLRANARYSVAVAYEQRDDKRRAKDNYEEFLSEFPNHSLSDEVRARLADLLIADKDYSDASRLLGNLAGGDSSITDYALLRLGYTLTLAGDEAKAANYYEDLLERFPQSKHADAARLSLGQLYSNAGRTADAERLLNRILQGKDDSAAQALHLLASNLLKQGKPVEAGRLLSEAESWTRSTSNYANLLMDYADALFAQGGKLTESQAAYEKVLELDSDGALAPRAAYNAAFSALLAKRLKDAQKWAQYFLRRFPQDPLRADVAYVAAESLLQAGEHASAAEAYSKLRRTIDTNHPNANLWALRHAMAHYLAGNYAESQTVLSSGRLQMNTPAEKAERLFILGACDLYQNLPATAAKRLSESHSASDKWASADETLLLLAEAQLRTGASEKAKSTLESLLRKYPNSKLKQQVNYKLAQIASGMNRYREAISGYRKVLADPESKNLHRFSQYGIAWALMQQQDYAAALDELEQLSTSTPDSIARETLLARGLCLRKLDKPQAAIASLRDYLDTRPAGNSLASGLYELGLAYTQLGQPSEATNVFERIAREVPDYPAMDKVLYELAWNNVDAGQSRQAENYFQKLADKFGDSPFAAEAAYMMGQSKYDDGNYAEAASLYRKAASQADSDPARSELHEKALYKLGWCYFELEQYDEASKHFSAQAKKYSDSPLGIDAIFMAGECAFNQDDFDDALAYYKQAAVRLADGNKSAASDQVRALVYLHGAQCYRERSDWKQAEKWLETIVDRYPGSEYLATAYYELAYSKQKQGENTAALELYDKVADENRRSEIGARARFMSGELHFSQRDFVSAIRDFTRVMFGFGAKSAPNNIKNWQAKAAFEAARCSEVLAENRRGDDREQILRKAQEYYDFIVQQHAEHDLARQAQSRLGELKKLR
ncbi:MAG TPA: hypothetical protein DDW52_04505 [Planctomycetaceae bacterium]|nr:hypothetical protein [Planctomycetaceae bacterium]